jgi:hypothetical protein
MFSIQHARELRGGSRNWPLTKHYHGVIQVTESLSGGFLLEALMTEREPNGT